ncbi:MAG: cell wall hydrolase [Bacilli bacterium]
MLINYTNKELDLIARTMRSEALAEGDLGMLMVGNVIVNRTLANCLTFKDIRTITQAIYQPNQFAGTKSPLFIGKATIKEKDLAKRILKGEYYYPATNALWFYSPAKNEKCKYYWYTQGFSGRYKSHCFYSPTPSVCKEIH